MNPLSEIIVDGQERVLTCGVPRHLPYELVPGKAFICVIHVVPAWRYLLT